MSYNRHTVQLDNFEGPLDLLLQLIDNQELNINDISIAKVTSDYLQAIKQLDYDHHSANTFLMLAVKLIRLKARALLDTKHTDDEVLSDELSLKKQLQTLQKYKQLAKKLELLFSSPMLVASSQRTIKSGQVNISISDIQRSYQQAISSAVPQKTPLRLKKQSTAQLRKMLLNNLQAQNTISLNNLSGLVNEPKESVTLFMLLLELIKSQKATYHATSATVEIGQLV